MDESQTGSKKNKLGVFVGRDGSKTLQNGLQNGSVVGRDGLKAGRRGLQNGHTQSNKKNSSNHYHLDIVPVCRLLGFSRP